MEEKNVLDQISFQIKRKGYDVDEVNVYVENLHKKYMEETLKTKKLSAVISDMENVIRDSLEEEYNEDKSILDNILDVILKNKKQSFQLQEKQKKISEMEERLGAFDNVQNKVMGILASAQEFRKEAEQKANEIMEKAEQEAQQMVQTVRREAESKCVEYNQKTRSTVEQTRKEMSDLYGNMKMILGLYFNEIQNVSDVIGQMRAEYSRLLQAELDKMQQESEDFGIERKVVELRDSIRKIEDLINKTLDETSIVHKEKYPPASDI